jgi:hypothetical protein
MEGRDTPSRGLDLTAKFIALNVASWGLRPMGDDNSFLQHISLRRERIDSSRTHAEIDGRRFDYGKDFLCNAFVGGAVTGPLVYVSHGWLHRAKNINAYEDIDVRDKIMIVSGGGYPPKEIGFGDLRGRQGEDWDHPYGYAHRHGARGVVLIPHFRTVFKWESKHQNDAERGNISVEKLLSQNDSQLPLGVYEGAYGMMMMPTTGTGRPLPAIIASVGMVDLLFRDEKEGAATVLHRMISGDSLKPFDLKPDKKISLSVGITLDILSTQNVVAVLEGSDPTLRNEYVAIGAHYDHLGIAKPVSGDAINNGADDNGSGTAAALAIAKALATGVRPKRSILFIWHTGEEKPGFFGARYFMAYPTVALNQIIAYVNLDMVGRSKKEGDKRPISERVTGPHEIYIIGPKRMSTDLAEIAERVNQSYLQLDFNYRYDGPAESTGMFYRSDQVLYAEKGIPVIWYFSGEHEDYHQPSDSPDKIDYEKVQKVARTVLMTAWELGNARTRPRVNAGSSQ